jgi:hypothetical protein
MARTARQVFEDHLRIGTEGAVEEGMKGNHRQHRGDPVRCVEPST